MNLHDVLRDLVRHNRYPNQSDLEDRLLTIDAHEQGFADLETYKAELGRRYAELAAERGPQPGETAEQKAARLEAENLRLRAQVEAQTQAGARSHQADRPDAPAASPAPAARL